ncbi:unnamed protein product [Brassica rapa]|uniref:Uncharacterized protein n=1 Tax=Brassica campestris TaxID=3711 RepID=A0A3P6ANQ3_BRACM|nr:unnamed protein product [Brassica rapa]CAG7906966.1 unnamed protein product [Brassica rapa]VDC89243.1 unnamed protein product [Brassica rapa]
MDNVSVSLSDLQTGCSSSTAAAFAAFLEARNVRCDYGLNGILFK